MNEVYALPVPNQDVSDVVRGCGQILTAALEDRTQNPKLRVDFENILVRLRIWAGNGGVFAPDTASLTYRLRDDPELLEVLLSILMKLKHDLDMAVHPPLLEETEDEDNASLERRPASVASSSSSSLLSLDFNAEEASSIGGPAKCIKEANDGVDRLYRLASILRKPHSSSENAKVFGLITKLKDKGEIEELEDVDDHARNHIKVHFPRTPEILVDRLVASVVFRRMKIRYRQRHKSKLNQGIAMAFTAQSLGKERPEVVAPEARPTYESSSRLEGNVRAKGKSRAHRMIPKVAVSATNASSIDRARFAAGDYASSTALSGITQAAVDRQQQLDVPRPPKHLDAGQNKQCPYCGLLVHLDEFKEPRWTRHILKDIDPYVCLFEDCKESHALFKTAREWLGHMQWQHNIVYACQAVGHEQSVFASAEDLRAHIRNDHSGTFTESQLPSLVNRGALPASNTLGNLNGSYLLAESQCLLCHKTVSQKADDGIADTNPEQSMQNHILEHLEALALLALPGDDDPVEVESNVRLSIQDEDAVLRVELDSLPMTSFEDTGARAPNDESVPDDDSNDDDWFTGHIGHSSFPIPENDPLIIELQAKQSKKDASAVKAEDTSVSGPMLTLRHHRDSDSLTETSKTHASLEQRLWKISVRHAQESSKSFWPPPMWQALVTEQAIVDELLDFGDKFSPKTALTLAKQILSGGSQRGLTVFTILLLIDKLDSVDHILQHCVHGGIRDRDLPLVLRRDNMGSYKLFHRGGDQVAACCLYRWRIVQLEAFNNLQRRLSPPVFGLNEDDNTLVHLDLDNEAILPWCAVEENLIPCPTMSGGFGTVSRVKIHPMCHKFHKTLKAVSDPDSQLDLPLFCLQSC